jgi:hypothetical protein
MISTKPFTVTNSNQIDRLRKRFDTWRKSHIRRTRIPGQLWDSAVRVARECGVCRTARTLHLDYYALKKRIAGAGITQGTLPSFIELRPAAASSSPECVIELEVQNGAKMRISIRGMGMPDLKSLSDTFWRGMQ